MNRYYSGYVLSTPWPPASDVWVNVYTTPDDTDIYYLGGMHRSREDAEDARRAVNAYAPVYPYLYRIRVRPKSVRRIEG